MKKLSIVEKDTFIHYVEYRLDVWSRWYQRHTIPPIGYPKKTMEAKLKELGGLLTQGQINSMPPDNPEAEEIESMVYQLKQQNERLAKVLRREYLHHGRQREKAQFLDISYTQYRVHLDMAKQWLAGRLSESQTYG